MRARHNVYAIDSTFPNTSLCFVYSIHWRAVFAYERTFIFFFRWCCYCSLRWRRVFDVRIYLWLIHRDSILIKFVLAYVLLTWFFYPLVSFWALPFTYVRWLRIPCDLFGCLLISSFHCSLRWFVWFVETALTLMSVCWCVCLFARVSWIPRNNLSSQNSTINFLTRWRTYRQIISRVKYLPIGLYAYWAFACL